jgi:hypothetical protein
MYLGADGVISVVGHNSYGQFGLGPHPGPPYNVLRIVPTFYPWTPAYDPSKVRRADCRGYVPSRRPLHLSW